LRHQVGNILWGVKFSLIVNFFLLVAALSRPLWPGQDHRMVSHVFVLDPSVTMCAGERQNGRWQEACSLIKREIRSLSFTDEATLIIAGPSPRVVVPWSGRRGDFIKELAKLQPATAITDIRPALQLAKNLAASRVNGEIHVVTDGICE
jgi:hypothetical protein